MGNVVLVTPNWRWDDSPLAVDTLRPPVSPPLEWSYLAPALGSRLSLVLDAYQADASLQAAASEILAEDPSVVVISSTPSLLYWRCPPLSLSAVSQLVAELRGAGVESRILLVGPHGTHSPDFALRASGADAVWLGSTDRLLGPFLAAESWTGPHLYSGPESGPKVIAVDNASELPRADYGVFVPGDYTPHMWLVDADERRRAAFFSAGALAEASRGCPWACSYCAKASVRDKYDRRRIDLLAAEVAQAAALGWDYLFFVDETFNLPSPHLDQVLAMLRRHDMAFGFQGRPDLINDATAQRLAAAGCVYVELGIDLVGDRTSRAAGRRQSLAAAERGVQACQQIIPIVRFNRLNATTVDYRELHFSSLGQDWDEPADPIYPYPMTPIGDALMARYGFTSFDWPFAERYSWWLRIEVFLQRRAPSLGEDVIRSLMAAFLSLNPEVARAVATSVDGLQFDINWLTKNKAVLGSGGELHIRDTGAR
jgi:anaerobic magnesium-protoporphyrin IX monomethyl ester cyclase